MEKIENKKLLLNTVAKGATETEFLMFLEFCKSTGLNPFKKEIWFVKTAQGVQMMTGINGFLTIANNHPQFDGMEVSLDEQDGKLISATAKVFRKDRKYPSCATVYLNEYFKPSKYGNGMWEKMPRVMLQKVAKSVALREAFPQELNGMYTQEEMPPEYSIQGPKPFTMLEKNAVEVSPAPEKKKANEIIKTYTYNLALIEDKEKREKIIKYLANNGGEIIYTTDGKILHESDREYSKLSDCLIKPFEDLSADELFDSIDSGEVKNDN